VRNALSLLQENLELVRQVPSNVANNGILSGILAGPTTIRTIEDVLESSGVSRDQIQRLQGIPSLEDQEKRQLAQALEPYLPDILSATRLVQEYLPLEKVYQKEKRNFEKRKKEKDRLFKVSPFLSIPGLIFFPLAGWVFLVPFLLFSSAVAGYSWREKKKLERLINVYSEAERLGISRAIPELRKALSWISDLYDYFPQTTQENIDNTVNEIIEELISKDYVYGWVRNWNTKDKIKIISNYLSTLLPSAE